VRARMCATEFLPTHKPSPVRLQATRAFFPERALHLRVHCSPQPLQCSALSLFLFLYTETIV